MTEAERAQIESEVRQALDVTLESYTESILRGDGQAAASFWTSDAWMLEPGIDLRGDEVGAYVAEVVGSGLIKAIEIDLLDLFVHGDVVYGIFEFSLTTEAEGQEPVTVINRAFNRFVKEDGVLKIDREVVGRRDAQAGS